MGELGGLSWLDAAVIVAFLALTTWIGGRLAGEQRSVRDFFLGGRRLPWYAVSASIVATEISAVTLVSLPSVVFRDGGDLTYLQLGLIGSFVARWVISLWLVPAYYEREIYSPYEYMGQRLGGGVRGTTSALFALGGVLAQSARVYLVAVVLEVILHRELAWVEAATGLPPIVTAVGAIGAVSVAWTWLGGIATVVWTDAVLFLVFLAAIAIALGTVLLGGEASAGEVLAAGRDAGKLRVLDFSPSLAKPYTFWAALIATSWWNVGAYGTDQLLAQRLLCCRDVRDAQRAIRWSYTAMLVTVLVGLIGVALHAYYAEHPLSGSALALYEEKPDRIFPIFLVQAVPPGLRGLVLAGAFAAAISSLDSILAALAQTTLATVVMPWRARRGKSTEDGRFAVRASRVLVLVFGVGLSALAVLMEVAARRESSILDLALSMAGYTQGALLAGFVLAFRGARLAGGGFVYAAPLSVVAVFALRWHEPWAVQGSAVLVGLILVVWGVRRLRPALAAGGAAARGAVRGTAALGVGGALVVALSASSVDVSFPWFAPFGCTVAYVWSLLVGGSETPAPRPVESER